MIYEIIHDTARDLYQPRAYKNKLAKLLGFYNCTYCNNLYYAQEVIKKWKKENRKDRYKIIKIDE